MIMARIVINVNNNNKDNKNRNHFNNDDNKGSYIFIYTIIYIYIYIYLFIYMRTHTHIYIHIHMYVSEICQQQLGVFACRVVGCRIWLNMPYSRRGVPKNGTVSEVQQASPVRFQLRFMTGHSHELKSNGQIFTDAEMLAATQHWKDIRQWSNVVN